MTNDLTLSAVIVRFLKKNETRSVLLILSFVLLALSVVFLNPHIFQKNIQVGEVALKDVYAPYDFSYKWEIDNEKTKQLQEETVRAVPFYVERYNLVGDNVKTKLEKFFEALMDESGKEAALADKAAGIRKVSGVELEDKDYKVFLEYDKKDVLRKETLQILKNVLHVGYISNEGLEALEKGGVLRVMIYDKDSASEIQRAPKELLNESNVVSTINSYEQDYFGDDWRVKQAVTDLIMSQLKPNLQLDEKRTKEERESVLKKLQPVYQEWHVKKNELIVEKGKRVTERDLTQIAQLRSFFSKDRTGSFFIGTILLFVLLGTVGAIHMRLIQKANILRNTKEISIVLLSMLFMMVISDFIIRMPQPSFFIPMESMGMMIMLLVGFSPAFLSTLLLSFFVATLAGGKMDVAIVLLVSSMVAIYAVKDARRRSKILWAGFLAGLAKFVAIVYAGIMGSLDVELYLQEGFWGVLSGLFSGVLVMGVLPVFEAIFQLPTNISLLELSDLNHPLLKKMAFEAPGTYHHSIMVGNLSEAACESVGANSLLARVGAYYHDIGKIAKPHYYSENEMGEKSKHSNLTPSMSALVIGKHVKEGVELAHKYKLNNSIIDLIQQHHGNCLISFFYQKALEKADEDTILSEDSFRYPGPKPQTKEAAILMLADSVEASSRALKDPTPASLRTSVQKVINNKFIDGQLDECDLTLKDMHKIADSFVRVLTAVFHTRIDYPDKDKNKEESDDRREHRSQDDRDGNDNILRK